jgi:hypothetical protein
MSCFDTQNVYLCRDPTGASFRRQSATLNADELMTLVIGLGGS